VPGRPPPAAPAPNPPGAHFLHDRALTARLVRASGACDGSLVLDLGAGRGAITGALARSGARVIAVERDARLAAVLRRRFEGQQRVGVAEADLITVPLPRREFLVVASPPFSVTTALCRRLLGDPALHLAGAELIIVDLRGLEFMDSTGLHRLVAAQQRMLQAGRRFGLVRGGEQVQRLFDLTGLAELLTMADTPDELLEVDQAPGAP